MRYLTTLAAAAPDGEATAPNNTAASPGLREAAGTGSEGDHMQTAEEAAHDERRRRAAAAAIPPSSVAMAPPGGRTVPLMTFVRAPPLFPPTRLGAFAGLTLLVDLDRTLVDNSTALIGAFGRRLTVADVTYTMATHHQQHLNTNASHDGAGAPRRTEQIALRPGVARFLRTMHAFGVALVIVSKSRRRRLEAILRAVVDPSGELFPMAPYASTKQRAVACAGGGAALFRCDTLGPCVMAAEDIRVAAGDAATFACKRISRIAAYRAAERRALSAAHTAIADATNKTPSPPDPPHLRPTTADADVAAPATPSFEDTSPRADVNTLCSSPIAPPLPPLLDPAKCFVLDDNPSDWHEDDHPHLVYAPSFTYGGQWAGDVGAEEAYWDPSAGPIAAELLRRAVKSAVAMKQRDAMARVRQREDEEARRRSAAHGVVVPSPQSTNTSNRYSNTSEPYSPLNYARESTAVIFDLPPPQVDAGPNSSEKGDGGTADAAAGGGGARQPSPPPAPRPNDVITAPRVFAEADLSNPPQAVEAVGEDQYVGGGGGSAELHSGGGVFACHVGACVVEEEDGGHWGAAVVEEPACHSDAYTSTQAAAVVEEECTGGPVIIEEECSGGGEGGGGGGLYVSAAVEVAPAPFVAPQSANALPAAEIVEEAAMAQSSRWASPIVEDVTPI